MMHFMMDLDVGSFIKLHAKSRKIEDENIVEKMLDMANSLAGEPLAASSNLTSLSGGQSRALMIADTALISNAPIVLIDEIENAGINKTKGIEILASEGKMVLIASHDPSLIVTAQKRVIMKNGSMSKLILSDEIERKHLKYFTKIDKLLEIDCSLYAHLGTDSTKAEKEEVKRRSIDIYRTIKTLDKKLGDELLYSEDLKQ